VLRFKCLADYKDFIFFLFNTSNYDKARYTANDTRYKPISQIIFFIIRSIGLFLSDLLGLSLFLSCNVAIKELLLSSALQIHYGLVNKAYIINIFL
jgi:hypothetical protein